MIEPTQRSEPLPGSMESAVSPPFIMGKRVLDICFALAGLPLLLVLVVFMLLITKLRSPGSIFFTQERVGYLGHRFKCYKFRTMHVGVSSSLHEQHIRKLFETSKPMAKLERTGDPRMIPGGVLLRASGLDELPQLLNVLRGEMTLVGPRPWTVYENELLTPEQKDRMLAVPGLTGLWQVSGKNRTTVQEMIQLDLNYARNYSFLLDLKIILKTGPMLVAQMFESRRLPWAKQVARHLQDFFGLNVPPSVQEAAKRMAPQSPLAQP